MSKFKHKKIKKSIKPKKSVKKIKKSIESKKKEKVNYNE